MLDPGPLWRHAVSREMRLVRVQADVTEALTAYARDFICAKSESRLRDRYQRNSMKILFPSLFTRNIKYAGIFYHYR